MCRRQGAKKGRQRAGLFFCIGLLLFWACMPTSLAAATYPYTTTTNDSVNMRRSASGTSVVLERLDEGQEIVVQGESGSYFKITFNGRTGYVMKKYVNALGGSSTTAPQATSTTNTVTGYPYQTTTKDSVNLRKSASTTAIILDRLPEGAELTVQGVSGDFLKVVYEGQTGYVMAEYINVKTIASANATPAPTPKPSSSNNYTALQKGSNGTQVRALQQALIELGFLTGSADGQFGAQTETAVKAFQTKNSQSASGVADSSMQTLLYEEKPLNSKGKATQVMTLAPIAGITMRLNNTGDAVVTLQEKLKALGYYTGTANGVYTSDTMAAVKVFQQKNGLGTDGLAGNQTQTKLYSQDALPASAVVTVTPLPVPTPPSVTVRQGDTGDAAKTVQQRLKDLGYLSGAVDGKFGAASANALKSFQKSHGLTQDGVAGAATQTVLFSVNALKAGATATPAVTATPAPTPLTQDNVIVIQSGTKGVPVLNLQKRLTELGYYSARMDGEYLATDIAAVRAFQSANGIKVDGIAGFSTQSILYSAAAIGPNTTAVPASTATPVPGSMTTLRQGDSGSEVIALQARLIALGFLTGKADGKYGMATASAVVAFQRANGLVRDGVAGPTTLTKLYATGGVSTAPAATPTATITILKQGDVNSAVKTLQTSLINLGYLSGSADGSFGLQTYLALRAFQSRNNLTADGIAGQQTLLLLSSSNAKPAETVPGATATPKPTAPADVTPKASQVRYANWYTEIRSRCRTYPYATVYDFSTGISWKVHMFSIGAHADSEPVSAADTANMNKAFGGKTTWTPKAVWVIMSDGRIYMASTHNTPHGVDHNTSNNFAGHLCIHFPRTLAEVQAIGDYATAHQKAIDLGWQATQNMIK